MNARVLLLAAGLLGGGAREAAAAEYDGSVAVTSDYLVRGISRSNDGPALQADFHAIGATDWLAGVFASVPTDADRANDAELNGFIGFTFKAAEDWHGKLLAGVYVYPWNQFGSVYDYGELDLDLRYGDWFGLSLSVSPDFPRATGYQGPQRVAASSAEVDVQRALRGPLYATFGAGYSAFGGAGPAGYAYWSVGAAYERAPLSFAGAFVGASAEAKSLFYGAETRNHWVFCMIWRF